MNHQASRIHSLFQKTFGGQPRLYFSPGRINLIGEHIDYNDGFVMPAAISKGIYFAFAANHSPVINFYAADPDEQVSIAVSDIGPSTGWANYVLSVVHELLLLGKKIGGFDCVFGGDIPQGSGMSSSAALEGGLAFALNEGFACGLNRTELALLCQRAEHGFPGVPCGIMDQYANMLGRKDQVLLIDCKELSHQYLPLRLGDYALVLMNSRVHHNLAAGEYALRRKQCEEGLAIIHSRFGIHSFREVEGTEKLLACKPLMDEVVFNRCLYVVEEIARVKKAASVLQEGRIEAFGELLFATHAGLRDRYAVSCPELDFLVEQARLDPEVIGSRLMGGGFGGCTLNLVRKSAVDRFISHTGEAFLKRFNRAAEAYPVETVDGTAAL